MSIWRGWSACRRTSRCQGTRRWSRLPTLPTLPRACCAATAPQIKRCAPAVLSKAAEICERMPAPCDHHHGSEAVLCVHPYVHICSTSLNTLNPSLCCRGCANRVSWRCSETGGRLGALAESPCKPQVSYAIGEQSYAALREAGAQLEEKSYPGMGHEAWPDEMRAVKTFIHEVLP